MEKQAIQIAISAGEKKNKLLDNHLSGYMLRAMLAGLYLSLICFLFWSLKNNLAESPFGNVVASLFFGVGLFTIIITGAELFTSNNMYMATTSLARLASWKQTAKLWSLCWLGNLIGSLLMAGLLFGAGVLDTMPVDHALLQGAAHKIDQTATAIFFKGILANWVVCLAVWVSLHLKEEVMKFISIIVIVFIFLYLGFEHSIANMGTFSFALMAKNSTISILGMGYNLLWATLGNIIGGAGLIGSAYWWLNKK